MKIKSKTYWWIDMTLFAGFLLAFFMSFTGIVLHQWIGIFGGLLAIIHMILHWDWVNAVNQRFFSKTNWIVRFKFLTDGALLVGFVLMTISGLLLSSWLNLTLNHYDQLLSFHIILSIVSLLLLLAKLGMHWKWIIKTTRNVISPLNTTNNPAHILKPTTSVSRSTQRRDFLRLLGVVGVGSVLALISATNSLAELNTSDPTSECLGVENSALSSDSITGYPQSASSYSSEGSICSIQCGRSCSYPGHCRRYIDSDGDGLCDYGECA
jgi:hypothetical protein